MRIRSIKPEFWRSQDISRIDDWGIRLLFVGLWSYVDDNGVGKDRLSNITADLFADDVERDPRETFARVSRGLQHLSEAGRITRYTVEGDPFLHITNWAKHQRIDKPNKPRYPLPTCGSAEIRDTLATSSRESRETPAPGTGEQRNRGTEEQGKALRASSSSHQSDPDDEARELETVSPETVFPKSWRPSTRHQAYAMEHALNIQDEALGFAAHARANGRTAVDWDAAFTGWLIKSKKNPTAGRSLRSTTDERVQAGIDLTRQLAAEEAAQTMKEIGA